MGGVNKKKYADKKPLQVAYEMGKNAFSRGIFDSPYRQRSILHKEWQRGFDTAFIENAKRTNSEHGYCY